jgi:hypothetical protein
MMFQDLRKDILPSGDMAGTSRFWKNPFSPQIQGGQQIIPLVIMICDFQQIQGGQQISNLPKSAGLPESAGKKWFSQKLMT